MKMCFTCFNTEKQIISICAVRSRVPLVISSLCTWYALLIIHTSDTPPPPLSVVLSSSRVQTND